jgi:long-chain acyl-CoA synthetase
VQAEKAAERPAPTATPGLDRVFRSIPEMFWARVADTPSKEAYRYPNGDRWDSLTWEQAGDKVRHLAGGLLSLGLDSEDRVGILSSTRLDWVLADLGVLCAGGATTTVYPSNTAEECAYILSDSATKYIFAEDDGQIAKLREKRDELTDLEKVITFDGKADGDWVLGIDDLAKLGREYLEANDGALEAISDAINPEQLATLIYTSGTTGKPKGVRLVHDCWTYTAEAMKSLDIMKADDLQYLWLPLSHSFGKVLTTGQLAIGFPTAVDGRIPKLVDNLAVVRPTFMAAAPRIFEKVYNKVIAGAKESAIKYWIFKRAVAVGAKVSKLRQRGKEPGGLLSLRYKIATKLVFSKLKARFGGRVRFFISGSAPLSKEIAEFFHAADILILEGYGLTETSAASYVNLPEAYKFGSVGFPLPGTQVEIAKEDGEILLKSPGVMRGYHNLPEKTAEVLTDEGWLHTGDIGEVDGEGYLRITDRKKDLIKTSGGKYVAPQHLEGRFKAVCPLASQIIVHGDKRNFCTALITLDEESVAPWAAEHGLSGKSYADLASDPKVIAMVQGYVDKMNDGLARYETVKKFALLPKDLTVEDKELTPSLKVKRKFVEKKYMELLDGMYEGAIGSL